MAPDYDSEGEAQHLQIGLEDEILSSLPFGLLLYWKFHWPIPIRAYTGLLCNPPTF
jgi:hypothetical protein